MSQNNHQEMGLEFLKLLQKHDVEPNFWCSEEYFQKAGFSVEVDRFGYWMVKGDGLQIFPQIHPDFGLKKTVGLEEQIWCDFYGNDLLGTPDFLDLEYIYNPQEIISMAGSRFKTFRKNHRKIETKYEASSLSYLPVEDHRHFRDSIDGLFLHWLDNRGEAETIHDDEVMYRYLTEGSNRWLLYHSRFGVLGINVWDENFKYVNYRYMICRPWPYLDEYMRWLFYSSPPQSNRLVNDGGVLDSPGLKRFKDRLNPIRIRQVHSWRTL